MRITRKLVLALSLATAVLAGAGPALAAPPTPAPVATTDIVAAAFPDVQNLCAQFAVDYNATGPANPLDCWLPSGVDPKCTTLIYPQSVTAMVADFKLHSSSGLPCLDLGFIDRQIKPTDGAGILTVLFGKDLTTWSGISGGNEVSNLTDIDLSAIYQCNASLISPSFPHAPVTWNEVGGTSTDAVVPILPQASSTVRQQWQTDINVTNAQLGSCVINGASPVDGSVIQEDEGTNSVFTSKFANYKDDLFPYSGGVYVCQVYTKFCPDAHGSLVLEDIDGKAPLTSAHTINVSGLSAFPELYIHGVYALTLNAGTAAAPKVPTSPIDLVPLLGQGNSSGWICGTTGQTDVKDYGFASAANCGALVGQ